MIFSSLYLLNSSSSNDFLLILLNFLVFIFIPGFSFLNRIRFSSISLNQQEFFEAYPIWMEEYESILHPKARFLLRLLSYSSMPVRVGVWAYQASYLLDSRKS